MPISLDDQARLPPLAPYGEVAERQRLADMKTFRQYLVQTGTAKALVELFKHTAKKEMRLDNPQILTQFLESHVEDVAKQRETDRMLEENAGLKESHADLKTRADALSAEVDKQRRLMVGKSLWRQLVSADFWEGQLDEDARAAGLSLTLMYQRLCGQKVDKATNKVLVNFLRPASHAPEELTDAPPMPLEKFSTWIAGCGDYEHTGVPEHLHVWIRDELLPRFSSVPVPNEAPYERELTQQIRNTGCYPDHLREAWGTPQSSVGNLVQLDPNLVALLNGAAEMFRWG